MKSNPHILERNKNIANKIIRGERIKDVALEYGISVEWARQILHKYCENKDKDCYLNALNEMNELLMVNLRALLGKSSVSNLLLSLYGLQTKSKPKFGAQTVSIKILRKKWLNFIEEVQIEDLDRLTFKCPNKFREIYLKSLKKFLVKSKNKAYLKYNELDHFSYVILNITGLKSNGLIPYEIYEHGLEILEILDVELIDEGREKVIEGFIKATKKNKKVSKYEVKILNRLINDVIKRGYITYQELSNKGFHKFKNGSIKKIFEKLRIKIIDEKSRKDFEESQLIGFFAGKLPANEKEIIKHLISIGKKRGYITNQELHDIFSEERLDNLYKMFRGLEIKIVDEKSILKK